MLPKMAASNLQNPRFFEHHSNKNNPIFPEPAESIRPAGQTQWMKNPVYFLFKLEYLDDSFRAEPEQLL